MSGRPDIATLDEMTGIAHTWLRRCKGQPDEGIPVNRFALRAVLASGTGVSDISTDASGVISWTAAGRQFTAEPQTA